MVRRLVAERARVHVLVRPGTPLDRIKPWQSNIQLHLADLRDLSATREAMAAASPDYIFHLASPSRGANLAEPGAVLDTIETIVKPLIGLVEAAADLPTPPRAFFRAGTIAEYGRIALPFRERRRESPITAYGAAMLAGTTFLDMLHPNLPFQAVTARLALTYGADQSEEFLIPQLIDACLVGRRFEIKRPDDRRDLIHVDDVISAFLALAETRNVRSGIVNVCTGTAPSVREVAAEVISATRCDPSLVEQRRRAEGEAIDELLCDPSLARERYSWSPRIGLRQGLAQVISARRTQIGACAPEQSAKLHV